MTKGKEIPKHSFVGSVEKHAIAHIEEAVLHDYPEYSRDGTR